MLRPFARIPGTRNLRADIREAESLVPRSQSPSQGEIAGLDQNCGVGMGGRFYTNRKNGHTIVTTWLGEEVSRDVQVNGNVITFNRNGMTFRGRLRQHEDCFHFKRIR